MSRSQPMRERLPELERERIVDLSIQAIRSEEGKEAIEYLKSKRRNFREQDIEYLIEQFKIGYMPQDVLNLYGDRHEFAGRIIMPVYDQHDSLVALSSRDWRENSFMPFFHESFVKSNYLYGLNVAKKYILMRKCAIVVEGEFDVSFLHTRGLKNVVGCMSSALQLRHIALLSRYCKEIFIVFDGDKSGQSSTNKIIETFNLNCFMISIIPVNLPEGYDPDTYVVKFGIDSFIELLRESRKKYELLNKDCFI